MHLSHGQGLREHLSFRRMHSRHDLALEGLLLLLLLLLLALVLLLVLVLVLLLLLVMPL